VCFKAFFVSIYFMFQSLAQPPMPAPHLRRTMAGLKGMEFCENKEKIIFFAKIMMAIEY
jgi:hypothetical protein